MVYCCPFPSCLECCLAAVMARRNIQDTEPNETQAVVTADMEQTVAMLGLSEIEKQELMQANQLGIPMDGISKEAISGNEMMHLLDWFVGYASPENMDEWESQLSALRQSNAKLCRFAAMAALYLAAPLR